MGLEWIFRGQSHWGKYKDNEALFIKGPATHYKQKIVIFAGGAKEDSYKKIRGNSYGMWIATEINLPHDNTIKEAFNRQLAAKRLKVFWVLTRITQGLPFIQSILTDTRSRRKRATSQAVIITCTVPSMTISISRRNVFMRSRAGMM